jgi:hypothetical protein
MSMRRNRQITERMIRAARLEPDLYEEVERDTNATGQAATVVLIAAVAAAIATLLRGSVVGAIVAIPAGFVGWIAWSFVTYWVGKTFFATAETRVTPGEMLRTLGFSQSPGVLGVVGFIPGIGPLISFLVGVWVLVAGVIAVRQAMDFDTGRAIATTVVGWLIFLVVTLVFGLIVAAAT